VVHGLCLGLEPLRVEKVSCFDSLQAEIILIECVAERLIERLRRAIGFLDSEHHLAHAIGECKHLANLKTSANRSRNALAANDDRFLVASTQGQAGSPNLAIVRTRVCEKNEKRTKKTAQVKQLFTGIDFESNVHEPNPRIAIRITHNNEASLLVFELAQFLLIVPATPLLVASAQRAYSAQTHIDFMFARVTSSAHCSSSLLDG
jgi:hypothetical protein